MSATTRRSTPTHSSASRATTGPRRLSIARRAIAPGLSTSSAAVPAGSTRATTISSARCAPVSHWTFGTRSRQMSYTLPPIVIAAERTPARDRAGGPEVPALPQVHARNPPSRSGDVSGAARAIRAWRDQAQRPRWTTKLIWAVDDLKLSLQLGKQIEAFASFAQFEMLARLCADLGKQCGGWRKQQNRDSQNGERKPSYPQRAEILSSRAAPQGANP